MGQGKENLGFGATVSWVRILSHSLALNILWNLSEPRLLANHLVKVPIVPASRGTRHRP